MGTFREKIRLFAKRNYEKPHLQNMAIACGVNYQQLSKYDDDDLPSGYNLKRLKSIGVSLDWLLNEMLDMTITGDFMDAAQNTNNQFDDEKTLLAIQEQIGNYLARREKMGEGK
ncbi:MAG: hypothetical protein ABIQ57_17720 [Candidatus Kapaibacterium sp.]